MEYKVITEGHPNEVWATGFFNEYGRKKAQDRIDAGYWHKLMYEEDRHKKLIVVEASNATSRDYYDKKREKYLLNE